MKKMKRIATIILALAFVLMNAVPVFAAETVYSQLDTSSLPYSTSPNTYLITKDSVLSWKKYNVMLGYNDMGTVKNTDPITEVYENRQGDTISGALNYSWTMDGSSLKPITESKKGPINLGITLTPSAAGLSVAFKTTRSFDGSIKIKLNVSSFATDGNKLSLAYIDGADSCQIHGTDTTTASVTPAAAEEITVQGGFIEFTISNGGNYALTKLEDKANSKATGTDSISTTGTGSEATATAGGDAAAVEEDAATTAVDTTTATNETIKVSQTDTSKQANSKTKATDTSKVTRAPHTGSDQNAYVFGVLVLAFGIGFVALKRHKDFI